MAEDSRTLLTEDIRDNGSILGSYYNVIANRLVAYGGQECWRIEARIIDDHYLLERTNILSGFEESFGIVELAEEEKAWKRMYTEAKRLARGRARMDKNKVIDLTSRATEEVSEEDIFYIPDSQLHMLRKRQR